MQWFLEVKKSTKLIKQKEMWMTFRLSNRGKQNINKTFPLIDMLLKQ